MATLILFHLPKLVKSKGLEQSVSNVVDGNQTVTLIFDDENQNLIAVGYETTKNQRYVSPEGETAGDNSFFSYLLLQTSNVTYRPFCNIDSINPLMTAV